jgi:hypothetical protein
MARVRRFTELRSPGTSRLHTEVDCGYRFITIGGDILVQLETYGSDDRAIPGKISQSVQLDRAAAIELLSILRRAFPEEEDDGTA